MIDGMHGRRWPGKEIQRRSQQRRTQPVPAGGAADIAALHHPWLVTQATGMLAVDANRAAARPTTGSDEPLSTWLTGLDAVLRAESRDQPQRYGAAVLCRILLGMLDSDPPPERDKLPYTAYQLLDHYHDPIEADAAFQTFDRGVDQVDAALTVLAAFGAIDHEGRITPLGRWALEQLQARVPPSVTPDLPAAELLARLAGLTDDQIRHRARLWLQGRSRDAAAEALLQAANTASSAGRMLALELIAQFDGDPEPYWRRALSLPNLAPHARSMLTVPDKGYEALDESDRYWLATEYALAALADHGVEDAYHELLEHGDLTILDQRGHPDAGLVRQALHDYLAADGGQPRIYQLKIELSRVRPPTWRRVLVPAGTNLGGLHEIIRAIYGWGGDHLHAFTSADGARYADPFYNLDGCGDEYDARLSRTLPQVGATMTYVYDFGDWWEHRITLEQVHDLDPDLTYPTCSAGRGDASVEDWNPDDPTDPIPFDRASINRRLANIRVPIPPCDVTSSNPPPSLRSTGSSVPTGARINGGASTTRPRGVAPLTGRTADGSIEA